ncbi:metallophosphoesterase [Paenibacillus apiarius]|uniref:metallophosphoesterase n=1 Tax=Paenibacillus apiarius TaxID=46240 RepID=UPI003B3A49EE
MIAAAVVIGVVAIGVLFGYMLWEARGLTITEEVVVLERLPSSFDGVRLFFITDFHRRIVTEQHLSELARHEKAELVLVGGDMIERGVPLERCLHNMGCLRRYAPVIGVHGNHDYKTDIRKLDENLRDIGVKLLDNEAMRLEQGGEFIWMAGWDDYSSGRTDIRLAMSEPRSEPHCTIVLTHDPLSLRGVDVSGIDLVLSGHTHGGQICVPGYGPVRTGKYYRKYLAGWYDYRDDANRRTKLFISRGFGTSHLPFRLNSKPEAHFITLRSSAKTTVS